MSVLFPFLPDWKSPVKTEYDYKTDIIVSRNGTEDRSAIRADPRLTFEYDCVPFLKGEIDGVQANYLTIAQGLDDGATVYAIAVPPLKSGVFDSNLYDTMFPEWQNLDNGLTDRIYGAGVLDLPGDNMIGVGSSGSNNKIFRDYHIDELGIPAREVDRGGVRVRIGGTMLSAGNGLGEGTGGGIVVLQLRCLPEVGIDFVPGTWTTNPHLSAFDVNTSFDDSEYEVATEIESEITLPVGSRYVRVYLNITTTFLLFAVSGLSGIYCRATWSRRSVADEPIYDRTATAEIQSFLHKHMQDDIYVPEWTRFSRLSAITPNGSTLLTFSEAPGAWGDVGNRVLVRYRSKLWLEEIVGRSGTDLIVSTFSEQDWPVGTFVHPVHTCMFQTMSLSAITSRASSVRVRFDAKPGESPGYDVLAAPVTLNGYELLLTKPNWIEPVVFQWENLAELVDFTHGRIEVQQPVNYNPNTARYLFTKGDSDQVELMLSLFHRIKGRRGLVYVPTWTNDISVSIGAHEGQRYLVTPDLEIYQRYLDSLTHNHAIVFYRDGTYQTNQVVTIRSAGPNTHIEFVDAWDQNVRAETVKFISWLPLCRFASDTLVVEWLTNRVANVTANFQTIKGPAA